MASPQMNKYNDLQNSLENYMDSAVYCITCFLWYRDKSAIVTPAIHWFFLEGLGSVLYTMDYPNCLQRDHNSCEGHIFPSKITSCDIHRPHMARSKGMHSLVLKNSQVRVYNAIPIGVLLPCYNKHYMISQIRLILAHPPQYAC